MAEPVSLSAAVSAAYRLVAVLWRVKEACRSKSNNDEILKELSIFISQLEQDSRALEQKRPRNNSALIVAGALADDLEKAAGYITECLEKGYFRLLWDVNNIRSKLNRVRETLMTSFQTKLQIIAFDVVIDGQRKQEEFQDVLMKIQVSLVDALSDASASTRQDFIDLRCDLQMMVKLVLEAVGTSRGGGNTFDIAGAMSDIRNTQAHTPDTEKFFEDVLLNLEQVTKAAISQEDVDQDFEDPLTNQRMCDPVKCSDGRTYNRWTIVDKNLVRCPYDPSMTDFQILVDDVDVRIRLHRQFPQQEKECLARRAKHREDALELFRKVEFGDALTKLNQVLQWSPSDRECLTKRAEILQMLQTEGASSSLGKQVSPRPGEEKRTSALEEGPTRTLLQDDVWFTNEGGDLYLVLTKLGNRPCPTSYRGFPGYYFEILWLGPEKLTGSLNAVSMGFKRPDARESTYRWGSTACRFPWGIRTETWKCDENDSAPGSLYLRNLPELWAEDNDMVIGAGINPQRKEVFFTQNGRLVWLLRGAAQLDDATNLFPFWRICSSGLPSQLRKEESMRVNLGQRPFRFPFERMNDPVFRASLKGRRVETRWFKTETICSPEKRWGRVNKQTFLEIEVDASEGDDGAYAKYFAALPARPVGF